MRIKGCCRWHSTGHLQTSAPHALRLFSMASQSDALPLSSYSTAVVFLPSVELQKKLNLVRSAWDKSYPRWTAHFTVLFPFVEPSHLPEAAARLRDACSAASLAPITADIDHVDTFSMRTYKTVYLSPSATAAASMKSAWRVAATTFGYSGRDFIPHLTLGQTPHGEDALNFLIGKGNALIASGLQWTTDCFVLLRKDEADGGRMKIAHVVPFQPSSPCSLSIAPELCPAWHFDSALGRWVSASPAPQPTPLKSLRVATYNILEDAAIPSSPRISAIVRAILESDADFIVLQEVSDVSLPLLLQNVELRSTYTWASYSPSAVLPLSRNVMMLSRAASFSWTTVDLGDKHKPAHIVITHIGSETSNLVFAAIHLSAGSSVEISAKRAKEMATLLAHVRSEWPAHEWIVLGDTNFQPTDGPIGDDVMDDAWELSGSPADSGPTYEPTLNSLAARTSRQDRSPKRYDRVYVKMGRFVAQNFSRFGFATPEIPASDHWGIAVSLAVTGPSASTPPVVTAEVPELDRHRPTLLETSLTDTELSEAARREGLVLSDASFLQRQAAADELRNVICSSGDTTNVCIRMAVVGSFALGVSVPSSDVDCLAVGNISSATFWRLARERVIALGWPNAHNIRLRRFVKEAAVPMMEFEVDGVKMDLQYCPAPQVAESWDTLPELPSNSPLFSLPVSTLRSLNAFRDSLALLKLVIPARRPAFVLAHRSLRHFCKRRGIFASKFGYLGSFHLSILLVRILESLPHSATAAQIVRVFLSEYGAWDWDVEAAYIGPPREYARAPREAMIILSPEKPSLNVASASSRSTVQSIIRAFQEGNRLLCDGAAWTEVCGTGLPSFITSYERYAKIDISFWGSSSMTGRGLVGHLESRFVHFLVQLQTSLPSIQAQFWPERLADASGGDGDSLQAFYLIGLSGARLDDTMQTRLALLEAFAQDIRGHARYYDEASAFIYASEVSRNALGTVCKDTFDWPDGGFDQPEAEDSDDESASRADEQGLSHDDSFALDRRKKEKKRKPPKAAGAAQSTAKLRPSADVYNRLMWDPSVSSEDYLIGYEDRFKGLKEMPIGSWKREVEDEAFIPFHRVVHFRRRTDNVVVWDRVKRVDLIFGSGVSPSE